MLESSQIHSDRVIQEFDKRESVSESMESTVQTVECLMEVLSELPCEWVRSSRIYEELESRDGEMPSRRAIRRWISKLEDRGMIEKRGSTRGTEILSLVEE